jgi:hypothetical protein
MFPYEVDPSGGGYLDCPGLCGHEELVCKLKITKSGLPPGVRLDLIIFWAETNFAVDLWNEESLFRTTLWPLPRWGWQVWVLHRQPPP